MEVKLSQPKIGKLEQINSSSEVIFILLEIYGTQLLPTFFNQQCKNSYKTKYRKMCFSLQEITLVLNM